MEMFSIVLGILVAAGAGFLFGRGTSTDNKEKSRLEQELQEKQAELDSFRHKVSSHFEKTAGLFNQVSDSYQSLYDHIATSSDQLCAAPNFQQLPDAEKKLVEVKLTPTSNSKSKQENVFDDTKLYNAHAYRYEDGKDPDSNEEKVLRDNGKVVDIETAKDDNGEPALDYAIKEKGVINHNSLNIDGIKSS